MLRVFKAVIACTVISLWRQAFSATTIQPPQRRCGGMADATDLKLVVTHSCAVASLAYARRLENKNDHLRRHTVNMASTVSGAPRSLTRAASTQ